MSDSGVKMLSYVPLFLGSHMIYQQKTKTFVAPLVEELKKTWNEGLESYSMISKNMEQVFLSLICLECDIPASRKLCGFLG